MTTLTSETTFTVVAAPEHYEEVEDLYLYPQNSGTLAPRELHYPGNVLPPLIYETNPDRWENFDSLPMTNRPMVKTELTIASAQIVHWLGYYPDRPIREIWRGADNRSRMTAYMLRRLYEYYVNPPETGYITWWPKDRTTRGFCIQIESLQVGGQEIITYDYLALAKGEVVPGEVIFQFRIVRV